MSRSDRRPGLGLVLYLALSSVIGLYFAFASIQGDFGLFRRLEIQAETERMAAERDAVSAEVARMRNLTRRLSDDYLDLDLLDERAREVLGTIRAEEVILGPDAGR